MNLLGTNTKLLKHNGTRYAVRGLTVAPHRLGGHNVCPEATPGCRASCCLWFAGRTNYESVREAMLWRKELLINSRSGFENRLRHEISNFALLAKVKRQTPAIRLNVASDLNWSHIARQFPDIAFYDYTKVRSRLLDRRWPANYELTYSRSERSNGRTMGAALRRGQNVAFVFDTSYVPQCHIVDTLPASWRVDGKDWEVIDGDKHDVRLRSLDGSGVIVGLRFKGSHARRAAAIKRGFCVAV